MKVISKEEFKKANPKQFYYNGKPTCLYLDRKGNVFKKLPFCIYQLSTGPDNAPYSTVNTTPFPGTNKRKTFSVHSMMAYTFLGDPPIPNAVVNHLNGNRHDNRIENLQWETSKGNSRHAAYTGLLSGITEVKTVEKICDYLDKGNISKKKIAELCEVKPGVVYGIWQGLSFIEISQKHIFFKRKFGGMKKMKTEFIFINGVQTHFTISDDGTLRNSMTNNIFKVNKRGKCTVSIKNQKYHVNVGRCVATHFLPNPNPMVYTEVFHKDGNRRNNDVRNLEWKKPSEIRKETYRTGTKELKYSDDQIRQACQLILDGVPRRKIEEQTGVNKFTVDDLRRGRAREDILQEFPELLKNSDSQKATEKVHMQWGDYYSIIIEYIKTTNLSNKEIVENLRLDDNVKDKAYALVKRLRKKYSPDCGVFQYSNSERMIYNGEAQNYFITKDGDIMNLKGRKLVRENSSTGYTFVKAKLNGSEKSSRVFIYRALAETFLKNLNPKEYTEIGFIDGNHKNYSLDNLKWVDHAEAFKYPALSDSIHHEESIFRTVTEDMANEICKVLQDHPDYSYPMIAKKFNVSKDSVASIAIGRSFKNISSQYDFSSRKFASTVKNQKITKMIFDGVPISALIHKIKKGTILKKKDIKKFIEYKRDELKENGFK